MKKIFTGLVFMVLFVLVNTQSALAASKATWWNFQSVDTMKYSRDTAREKLTDPSFDAVIDSQVRQIAEIGATHVAIATPYDEEFVPFLTRWVVAARKYNLHVWFRGNWSGWEGWFEYPKISREQHIQMTKNFIMKHSDLIQNGDVFSACPECENGGPGDPRLTRDVEGHRKFLIDEYKMTSGLFLNQGKDVRTNFNSMNADVARLIMDTETTQELGGIVVIDHYVPTPEILAADVVEIAKSSGGRVVLGEYGAPIPGINPSMTEKQQADWVNKSLGLLVDLPELEGINYWVSTGGSTQLWNENGVARLAVGALKSFFSPNVGTLTVKNAINGPVTAASASYLNHTFYADSKGTISIPEPLLQDIATIAAPGYVSVQIALDPLSDSKILRLEKTNPSWLFNALSLLYRTFMVYNQ
jgi:hypothetical protein